MGQILSQSLCVMVGGALGSLARFLVSKAFVQRFPNANFAIGTFVVNVTGCFVIGILMTLFIERLRLPSYWHLFTVVGFLGGYTTFSSFEFDAYLAFRGGHSLMALTYLVASVVTGYGAVWLGASLVQKL